MFIYQSGGINLKKKIYLVFISVFLLVIASSFTGCSSKTNSDSKVVVIGHDINFVPFEYKDSKTGDYVGFDIEFIKAIADEVGFEYTLEPMSFDGLIPALQAGKIDIAIAGMTIKPERAEKVDFSQPYYDAGLHLLVRADEVKINGIEDLNGKVIASKTGTTSYDFAKEVNGVEEVTPFETIIEAYQELERGSADGVIFDSPAVLRYANNEGKEKVKIVGPLYEGQQYGIAFKKGSTLRYKVDNAIDKLRENGTYGDIYEKWFGKRP